MSFNTGSKPQGKKQDTTHTKQNQSRGNKKWSANNNHTQNNSTRGGNYHTPFNNNNNGTTQSSSNSSTMIEDHDLLHHMHDRMLFLLGNLYGSKVQVTVRNGTKYEGIFQGATTEGDLGVSLTLARKIHDPATPAIDKSKSTLSPVLPSLLIFSKDLVEITALDTDLTAGEASWPEKDTFKTDTDISGKGEFKERQLHKWNPELPEGGGILESLEDGLQSSNGGGSWDQFAANEKLFGLKTDFDEELYTTHLNRSAPDYKDREKRAIEKANEIQKSATNNPHMLEERNITMTNDSGMDEEDKYGAVIRDHQEKDNVYLPPAIRDKQPQPKPQERLANLPSFPPGSPLHKLKTGILANGSSSLHESSNLKPINDKQAPKRFECEVADSFQQFARREKGKLQAKRKALNKKEQRDTMAELLDFHKNFKLNMPAPPDMLPLLAKSKKSPTSSSGTNPSDKSSSESSPGSQQTSDSVTATNTAKKATEATKSSIDSNDSKKSGFKFNIKATEFKPNPAAAAFVPGGAKIGTSADESATVTHRPLRKGGFDDPVTIAEIFKSPLAKGKNKKPNTIGPTWPYGSKQYRHQFNQYNPYSEDMFTGYPAPAYGYGYPQYRYHQQYVPGMPTIPVQQQNVSYMSPQFVPSVPITNAPMHHGGYSPQMPNGSPHGSPFPPQGYSSPQRSPMPPPNGLPPPPPPPQAYQYQGNHSPSGPMPVRYTPEMMTPPSGTPVMMQQHQRPVMEHKSPGATHYPSTNYSPERMNSPSQTDLTEP